MTLLLDTSEIVAALRRRPRYDHRGFDQARSEGRALAVSSVALHELIHGAFASFQPETNLALLDRYLRDFEIVDFTPADARVSGRLAADLQSVGTPIGEIDILLAGQALSRGWTVVTRNVRHFGRVPGLSLIDWSVGPDPRSPDEIAARVSG